MASVAPIIIECIDYLAYRAIFTRVVFPFVRGCTGEISNNFFFKPIFFSLQSYRYGVSFEYSSRQVLKKNIFSCLKRVFLHFFSGKNGFLAGIHAVLTVGWPFKPLVDCILHSYMYIHSVSAP